NYYPGTKWIRMKERENPWKKGEEEEEEEYKPEIYDPVDPSKIKVANGPDEGIEKVENGKVKYKFNEIDNGINRKSYLGEYKIVNNLPRNPIGKTGIKGRGQLWRWGPNHAADPIVTRWKIDKTTNSKIIDPISKKPILEFIAILRKDGGGWAIPGGMVESGDTVSNTLKKEFGEEALNSLDSNLTTEQKKSLESSLNYFFSHSQFSHLIFKGYVDDPRNTDNSWIETVAVNFHDDQGIYASRFPLHAGDDAASVTWMTVSDHLQLYASHKLFLHQVALFHHAHW
ncbi:hypothetical protein RFI_11612, partial [Reticulomyxa filosa]